MSGDVRHKFRTRNQFCAQRHEVCGRHLTVDEREAAMNEFIAKIFQCNLGRVIGATEHGLPIEDAAECNSVQPSDQLIGLPYLYAMSESQPKHSTVRKAHIAHDPGATGAQFGVAARSDDIV